MYFLSITDDFAAAHWLEGYRGACAELHGHTWKVEVTVGAEKVRGLGMVVDFKDLKRIFKKTLAVFDHSCLNKHLPKGLNPTCENMARELYYMLKREFEYFENEGIFTLVGVTVWESKDARVMYTEGWGYHGAEKEAKGSRPEGSQNK